jgi:lipid-binding SYLF domain-containing protein
MVNSPIPQELGQQCKVAAKIINKFVKPDSSFGPDQYIPPTILANAKGVAILTVIKAGFLFSGRAGAGLVVARLPDGSWSAPHI